MSDIQLIKDKLDIVDFINEYVRLKPAGVNHKGLCPFHQEKSPSFMVNRERQRWHCFGCSKGGDVFTFVEEIEGMDFVEALKFLANRTGVPLTRQTSDINSSQKNRLKDINTEAARFFHKFLLQLPIAESARAYLKQRGLTLETIEEWQIGYISDQWDLLTKYLLKKGYSIDDLVASGLTIKRDGADAVTQRGFYDRFRGRVMFPIWDVHGTVVGFTGRVLVETEHSGGKYVNTPQTPLYDKSRVVFGLNKAKQEIRAKNQIVMVEGQMDVIACHQAGMKQVVATSGTAMTEYQVQLLKRYAETMVIAFDADAAGQAAAKRGIDIALAEGMNIKVIRIPDGAGKDPDECIKKNKEVWFRAVDEAVDIMEWYLSKSFTGRSIQNPKDKQVIVNDMLPEIMRIPFATERDHWLREFSLRVRVDTDVLREEMDRIKKKLETGNLPVRQAGLKLENKQTSTALDNLPSGNKSTESKNKSDFRDSRLELLFERLLVILLRFPSQFLVSSFQFLDHLSTSRYFPLYKAIKEQYTRNAAIDMALLQAFTGGEGALSPDVLLMKGELDFSSFTEKDAQAEIKQLLEQMRTEWVKQERKKIQQAIEQAEKSGNKAELETLLQQFQDIHTV